MGHLDLDWEIAIGYVLGGSGIAGWLFAYLEFRQQRQLEAKRLFRELVLTPDMMQLYGSQFDLLDLQDAYVELKAGKKPMVNLPETEGRKVEISNERELDALALKVYARIDSLTTKVSSGALTLLFPTRLKRRLETSCEHSGPARARMILKKLKVSFPNLEKK